MPATDNLCFEFWELWRGYKFKNPRKPVAVAVAVAAFPIADLLVGDILTM